MATKTLVDLTAQVALDGTEELYGIGGPSGAKTDRRIPAALLRGQDGAQGVSVTSAAVNGSGHLILTLSNNTTVDAGVVVGPQGASITGASINGSGHLILMLSNSTTVDAGALPSGEGGASVNAAPVATSFDPATDTLLMNAGGSGGTTKQIALPNLGVGPSSGAISGGYTLTANDALPKVLIATGAATLTAPASVPDGFFGVVIAGPSGSVSFDDSITTTLTDGLSAGQHAFLIGTTALTPNRLYALAGGGAAAVPSATISSVTVTSSEPYYAGAAIAVSVVTANYNGTPSLSYSLDNGDTWSPILASLTPTGGTFNVTFVGANSSAKVMVRDANNTSITGQTSAINVQAPVTPIISITSISSVIVGATATANVSFAGGAPTPLD